MEKTMTELPINQKEYLKKYLAIGKAPGEKKRKKKKPASSRVQIIDDDAIPVAEKTPIDDDVLLVNEDAPQIVAIIDERPPSMRIDEKTKNPLWQPIGSVSDSAEGEQKQMIKAFKIETKSNDTPFARPEKKKKKQTKGDDSPRRSQTESRDYSPVRDVVIKQERQSVPRSVDGSPPRRITDEDISPSRRGREMKRDNDISPPRKKRDGDISPPRNETRSDDISPPRRRRRDSDSSPPRRKREPARSDDISPPRRRKREDSSPLRRRREDKDRSKTNFKNRSPSRYNSNRNGGPPPRRQEDPRRPRSPPIQIKQEKMDKTLDGKTAGLQNARELIEETRNFHSRENNLFKGLSKEVSGENAHTVHRDRKTGRIRNLEEEEERQRKKREEEEQNKAKYERWGRGLAQVESREQQLKDELHEMSKPLARYADDEDLERYLKEQEREGDPMLAYIRKKRRKKAIDAGESFKPQFQGEFNPNRYGIRPGHRWDGVDRSNGYEKKWFEVQNQKKALQEESYKWSTEDM